MTTFRVLGGQPSAVRFLTSTEPSVGGYNSPNSTDYLAILIQSTQRKDELHVHLELVLVPRDVVLLLLHLALHARCLPPQVLLVLDQRMGSNGVNTSHSQV